MHEWLSSKGETMNNVNTSRRTFLKVGALAGMGAVGVGMLGGCTPQQQSDTTGTGSAVPSEINWDGQFDVIVVGFGAAGASAAIAAAEEGAQVLIVDKAPEGHEGGNSRYCAQLFVSINDYNQGLEHYKALRGDFYTPDDVLEAYVEGMVNVRDTLTKWGANESEMVDLTDAKISNLTVEYPELPGAEAIRTNLIDKTIMAAALWRFLKKGVNARKDQIDCWYESPGTALIQDPVSKMIVGVEIEHEGKKVNIAAKNGVVMALGGYENNPLYTQQYTGYTQMFPIGTLYNEGDGLAMVQAAGAKLWHMGAWENNGISLIQQADRVRNTGQKIFFMKGSTILVGADGRRYIAEDLEQRHGHVEVGGSWLMPKRPDRNFFIFDQDQVDSIDPEGSPVDPTAVIKPFANWSDDLSKEMEAGRIIKADSLASLADQLGIDAANLQTTIDLFGQSAESGLDVLGRQAENMRAFGAGPFYGMEVWPSILNSQGGPERTAKGEVVDTNNDPLPHLYAAGEFGGVTSHLYQGGGNISECIVFGNISGSGAASSKEDAFEVDASGLTFGPGSGEISIYDQEPDTSGLDAGEAIGVGEGLGGPIWVKISTEGKALTNIEVLRHTETEGVGDVAINSLPLIIVEAGTPEVDVVSGATLSSAGVIGAVVDALGKL